MKLDSHVHIEKGPYTLEWIARFVETAQMRGIDEVWLLEHSYRFLEFVPLYDSVRADCPWFDAWFAGKAGRLSLDDYRRLVESARSADWPVRLRFGLEICHFSEDAARLAVENVRQAAGLDFLVGSIHFIDGFPFDHQLSHWCGMDVDRLFRRFFEQTTELAESGLYDGLAHPDSIRLFGHNPGFSLDGAYEALARTLAAAGLYAEWNSGAARRTGCAPGLHPDLGRALRRHGVRLMPASDAHRPEDVGAGLERFFERF